MTAKKRRIGFGFWLAVAWLVIIVLAAILAPWLPLKDPEKSFVVAGERPPYAPSREFWFGTDQLSRDMFSRTIWGARISLTVGFASIALGMLVGGSLGMIAGYFRGKYNSVITAYFVVVLSFPALMLADPDHLPPESDPVHDRVHVRFPGDPLGRHGLAGIDHRRSPTVSSCSPHERSVPSTLASSCASCCRTW